MPFINIRKPKGLESLSPDELENLIQQTKTEISLLEKDNERRQEKFNTLMKEGSKVSGSKRVQIAKELETLERKIHSNEKEISTRTKRIELIEEVKESKTSVSPSSVDTILSNTNTAAIRNEILITKTKKKVENQKTDDLLNTVRDLQIDDDEGTSVLGSKYMEMFKEMDRNDNTLKPGKINKEKKTDTNEDEDEQNQVKGE
ncbi:MAG: hypothetical protein ACYCSO_08525 [Cuniculiplasma sp.]